MKARFLSLLAVVLCLVSCQRDADDLNVAMGGEQDVMLTVSLPETTRADSAEGFDIANIASTGYSLRYILEIYRVDGENVVDNTCQRFVEPSKNTSMTFPVRLAPGYDYRIVAWTDIVEGDSREDRYYYTKEGLDNVVIKDNGTVNWNAMDETRDAYTGLQTITFNNTSDLKDMELTRPFAKVRVVATDIEDIRNVGLEPTTATVTYSQNMYFKYNAVADVENKGVAEGAKAKSHTYTYAQTATKYDDATGEFTLFTDYIFVPELGTAKFELSVKDQNGGEIKYNHFNTEIFVERNKLTTIKGDVLTTGGNVKVDVTGGFTKPDNDVEWKEASTAQDLVNIITEVNNATTDEETHIVLNGDINLDNLLGAGIFSTRAASSASITIASGKEVVLDLKDYNITGTDNETASFGLFNIQPGAKFTIEGKSGSIKLTAKNNRGWDAYSSVISNQRGEFVLNGGTIEHLGGTDMAYGIDNLTNTGAQNAKATINGGTVKSTYRAIRQFLNSATGLNELYVNGGTINGSNNKSIWMQNANTSVNPGKLVVSEKANLYGDVMISGANAPELAIELSLANAALKNDATVVPSKLPIGYDVVEENGVWVVKFTPVAMIGEKGYATLAKAVAAVEDGGTITLVANEVFTEKNYFDNGGWKDGLGYAGDKSFTIDLNNYTISQNGALNDYLIWIKNDGSKANTITLKNGTLDAGTTAYCAFATASSNKQKITINFENVNLVGNNSNGAVAKIRGGAELNVKAGTVITGNNNYVGIECVNSTTNIYEGAEIYQKGTSSSWGCLVGVSGNGTVNVYGGKGTSARGGFIAMTSGGIINVYGGEWIANVNGTYASDNKGILIAQSDKQYNAGAGDSIINVTGGTFKGGYNCYGNKVGDAQINIKGGNFNADPSAYVVDGYKAEEANGVWTVVVDPVAKIGETEYATLEEAVAAAEAGNTITVLRDATLSAALTMPAGVTLNGNGKQINGTINAGGDLTFAGHTKVTSFSASYYDRVITIGEGACLEVTGSGRVSLAYGNTFNITGSIEDAKTADKAEISPSLIIPAGISITGGNNATMNVTNAYVQIGSTSSKNNSANGTFNLNFENSIAEFTDQFTFAEPTSGKNPTFNVNIKDSVLTTPTKMCIAAPNSNVVIDNSTVTLGSYLRNSGALTLKNGSVLTGSTIQFGENGGNNGAINVDNSSLTVTASSTGHAFDGKGTGSITATNGATVAVDYYKDMTITVDGTSTFIGTEVK